MTIVTIRLFLHIGGPFSEWPDNKSPTIWDPCCGL